MIGMQYKILLPRDYNMEIIRKRVLDNGSKTDGFTELMFKFYVITERTNFNNNYSSYAPIYLWKNSVGMNKFIFDGYYDNILNSFGWHHINIGVPLFNHIDQRIKKAKYIVEYAGSILENTTLKHFKEDIIEKFSLKEEGISDICFYNPDKWNYSYLKFFDCKPIHIEDSTSVYEILHISN